VSRRSKKRRRLTRVPRVGIVVGDAPGRLRAHPEAHPTVLEALRFRAEAVDPVPISAELPELEEGTTLWIDVVGLRAVETVERLGQKYGVHPLALEDVMGTASRPKVDVYGNGFLVVVQMPSPKDGPGVYEQVGFFCAKNLVITFQHRAGDCFGPVRARLQDASSRVRTSGPDYLTYALVDAVVDSFFPFVEDITDRLTALEEEMLGPGGKDPVSDLLTLKREQLRLRRAAVPLQSVITALRAPTVPEMTDATRVFLRDCLDNVLLLAERADAQRELADSLLQVHLGLASQRLNEVMRLLTVISTVFMPLGFVAGLYGMNFDPAVSPWNMPETRWAWGYPFALGIMASLAGGLLLYFRRRGWLGRPGGA
jgi:magnesium transporter